ncbi:MAG: hypothetical protein AAB522_00780 [Patescibacteria group bacterium]
MTKILILAVFLCNAEAYAQNTKNTIIFDETGKSILRIYTVCEYKVILKNPVDKEVKIYTTMIGNGFFAEDHSDFGDFVVSANHLFLCNATIGELVSRKVLEELDRSTKEDLSPENITVMKDGKINDILAYIYDGTLVSSINSNLKVLYHTDPPKTLSDPDAVLLKITVPKGVSHAHSSLMEDKNFDKIFYQESIIGKEVIARGFLTFSNGWFLRYRNALIEWIRPEIFQINELLDQGLSGGPVTYFDNKKTYAIGVISRGPAQQNNHVFDMSWITVIKKSFLDKRDKK